MGLLLLVSTAGFLTPAESPEAKALTYLAREVPAWSAENKCYSCHNNGDAARALVAAVERGRSVPETALKDTLAWLRRPKDWDHTGGDTPNKDKVLARIQFAAVLRDAVEAGLVKERDALGKPAELVAELQKDDGSWRPEGEGVGSPATHGPILATHLARRTLQAADPKRYREPLGKAEDWLRKAPVNNVLDAAAFLWAMEGVEGEAVAKRKDQCLEIIRKGQSRDGGWGPYVTSQSEPFDTAVVLLGLWHLREREGVGEMIGRGRKYLLSCQTEEGHWPATTRPAGSDSYAQRLSTTGWVVQALLTTARPE
jgi:hypothetical protein